ncbi:SDR family NAD(P)-dependent oxidoreductase [Ruegeria sp. SCP11]|uniref:SDR family NAD(P)-dependent oxidoreductase n=1 Tax=Ruegeria sp. SCP11 TaxID=3141378 RepID=UPI00333C7DD7
MQDFESKTVVVTGSATGIGKELALQMGQEGAKVVICGRRLDRVQEAVAELKAEGIKVAGTACDVAERSQVDALADFAEAEFGSVDVLINNAGIGQNPTPLIDMDLDVFRRVYEINIFGTLNGIQVFGRRMLDRGTPRAIYNLGSENSVFTAVPSSHAYVSSKHALLAITELLAEETPDFMDVALIMPGLVVSEMSQGFGMPTDQFVKRVLNQLKAGEFFAVSHAYNKVRIDDRYGKLARAYDTYAQRYEGDIEYDIRNFLETSAVGA